MYTLLAVVISAFQILYQAQVASYGCSSSAEVADLQRVRSDVETFQKLLFSQVAYGQCITIGEGAVVDGMIEPTDTTVLRINVQSDPPGYIVPSADFKPVEADKGR